MNEMIQLSFKSIILNLLIFCACLFNFSVAQKNDNEKDIDKITIIYPKSNQLINDQNGKFLILGNTSNPLIPVFINNEKIGVDKNGGFIHYTSAIIPELTDSVYLSDKDYIEGFVIISTGQSSGDSIHFPVMLSKPLRTLPEDSIRIDRNFSIEPSEDQFLLPGEILEIKIKATPNCKASFSIEGEKEKYPLTETFITNQFYLSEAVFGSGFKLLKDTIRGIYEGHLIVPEKDWKDKSVFVHLEHPKLGKKDFKLTSKVSINKINQLKIAKILFDPNLVIGRIGPMLGYKLFLPEGVKGICDGKQKGFYRLKLSSNQRIFVPESSVEILPEGTLPPKSTVEVIRTRDDGEYVRVEIGLHEKLPYEITQTTNPVSLRLKIYYAKSNIDWIFYDRNQNLIDNITWNQLSDVELEIFIPLNQKHLWGYQAFYEDNILVLKIKKTPRIEKRFLFFGNPLKDKRIVLDPGHNPEFGAVGPTGLKEKDINLELALLTKQVLEEAGAKVFLTREDNPLSLRERKAKVLSFNPDFSISIHNNAVPDGVNPLVHNGFSVYFYNQNARDFAFILHKKLKENLNLPDFGCYWDNLYMCRIPETIAILVEPAFIIHPDQESLLRDKKFQMKIANSIKEALIEFLEGVRE